MHRSFLLFALLLAACAQTGHESAPTILPLHRPTSAPNEPPLAPVTMDAAPLESLSLEHARSLALQRSPTAIAADAVLLRARARIDDARVAFNPTLSLGTTGTLNDRAASFNIPGVGSITTSPQWQQVWTASSRISLFDFGRDRAALEAAEIEAGAAAMDGNSARQRLLHDVTLAWHRVHTAAGNLKVSEETLLLAEKQVLDAQSLVEAGKRTRDTLLTAAVDLLGRRQDLLVTQNAKVQSVRVLNILLCRALEAETTLAPASETAVTTPPLSALMESARAHNPALLALRARRDALSHSRTSNEQSAWPELALNVNGTRDSSATFGSPAQSAQAVFSLNWLAVDGGHRAARGAGLSAELMELRAQELKLIQQIDTDLSRAVLDLAEAHSAVELAQQSVLAATENYRIVNERAAAGTLSAREVLEARRTLATSRYAGTEALFRRHTALAWIENLTGSAQTGN
ncbi:MAG: TolC family protein [Planctomycetes bacterium]|nr:TolC family protein [Planctomycetota bacterium]